MIPKNLSAINSCVRTIDGRESYPYLTLTIGAVEPGVALDLLHNSPTDETALDFVGPVGDSHCLIVFKSTTTWSCRRSRGLPLRSSPFPRQ